jgi:pimeloyl-ACP methyl ester carboxylesterase
MTSMSSERPHVLLLHGQPGSTRDWEAVRALLEPDARVLAPDRPGWDGRSAARGIAANARAGLAMLDAVGAQRAVVVGHSLGGTIAAMLAVLAPARVQGLVLAAPAATRDALTRSDHVLALPLIGDLAAPALLGGFGLAAVAEPLRSRIAARTPLDERYLHASGRRLLRPRAWRSFVVEQRALLRELPELERQLARIAVPTAILAGSEDRMVPPPAARALAQRIPSARLIELPGVGHLLPQLAAPALADLTRSMLG